jgi:hypothetical protein
MAVDDKKPVEIKINSGSFVGSTFAQIAGVTVSDTDITLEFIYINPQIKTEGQTVARVTMPVNAGNELAKVITETYNKHEQKKTITK